MRSRVSVLLCAGTLVLAGCGDPLKDVDRFSDVDVAPDEPAAGAVESPKDAAQEGGFLSGLLNRNKAQSEPQAVAASDAPDAVQGEQVSADVFVPVGEDGVMEAPIVTSPDPETASTTTGGGLLGRLVGAAAATRAEREAAEVDATVEVAALAPASETTTDASPETVVAVAEQAAQPAPEPAVLPEPKRASLFGNFLKAPKEADKDTTVQKVALVPEAEAEPAPKAEPAVAKPRAKRGGLFGPRAKTPKPGSPDYEQVGPGVTLPYGKMARLCGVSAARLGKKVEKFPASGRGYTLYDSKPGSTGQRSFFVTGFDDGCARQFTAALALFASPEMHEQIRYGLPSRGRAFTSADKAYEGVKTKVCRVARGKPCGAKMDKLSKNTAFISVYERFGGGSGWKNILLHDGQVSAMDVRG